MIIQSYLCILILILHLWIGLWYLSGYQQTESVFQVLMSPDGGNNILLSSVLAVNNVLFNSMLHISAYTHSLSFV